jgi:hypothetical protein
MWLFDGEYWVWMSGSSSPNQKASYGEKGVTSPSNNPGARYGATGWTDNDGKIWMFGGAVSDQLDMNNVWLYEYDTNDIPPVVIKLDASNSIHIFGKVQGHNIELISNDLLIEGSVESL